MKKFMFVVLSLFVFTNFMYGQKIFDIKSGIVTSTTSMDAGSECSTNTIFTMFFDEYGEKLAYEFKTITHENGKDKVEYSRMVVKDNKYYSINDSEKTLNVLSPNMAGINMMDLDTLIKKYNIKKIGEEKILGFLCDVYENNKIKFWSYKKVPLKSRYNMMSEIVSEPKSAKFNVKIDEAKFKIPNYKTTDISKELDKMMTPEQKQQMQEIMNKILGG